MMQYGPECAIIAGPNGAGKSSIVKQVSLPGQFINADDIARQLNPDKASLEAGRIVIKTLDALLTAGVDFAYETTLSSRQSLHVLRRAKASGYRTILIFVALYSAALHVKRVRQRVLSGGHDIPEDIIRRRYEHSFENLALAIPDADAVMIFDNSSSTGPLLRLHINANVVVHNRLDATRRFDRHVAYVAARGLGIPTDSLLDVI